MFRFQAVRQVARAARTPAPRGAARAPRDAAFPARLFTSAPARFSKDSKSDDVDNATTSSEPGASGDHEGQYARTQDDIRVEYPEEKDLPRSLPVQGRGGYHFKRTLASFSLDGRVGVVTGGARGLGLVMAQALVASGADVALVDMNKDEAQSSAQQLIQTFKDENPGTEKYEDCMPTRPELIFVQSSQGDGPFLRCLQSNIREPVFGRDLEGTRQSR